MTRSHDVLYVVQRLLGEGVQIYGSTNGAWTMIQPAAKLSKHGRPAAIHSKGPAWTSTVDDSTVGAAAVTNAPKGGAIPQLLLKATVKEAAIAATR